MSENVQNGLVEGDSSIVLINEGGKAELVGSLPPSGGCIGVPLSVISHSSAGCSDSEPVGNFWGSLGVQSWGGVFPIMLAPILSHPCLQDVMRDCVKILEDGKSDAHPICLVFLRCWPNVLKGKKGQSHRTCFPECKWALGGGCCLFFEESLVNHVWNFAFFSSGQSPLSSPMSGLWAPVHFPKVSPRCPEYLCITFVLLLSLSDVSDSFATP